MYPAHQLFPQNEDAELFALGGMLEAYDGLRHALEVSKSSRKDKREELMRRVQATARSKTLADAADTLTGGIDRREMVGFSISRAIRAQLEQNPKSAPLEDAVSNYAANRSGCVPNGFWLPLQVSAGAFERDFNVGTSTQAGNLLGAARDQNGNLTADPLRRISVTAGLGATFLAGLKSTLSLPAFTSSTTLAWKSEVAAATSITEATVQHTIDPKRCAATMTLSRQAVIQATPALDAAIMRHLTAACFEQLENGLFNGDGTSDSPVGIRSTTGVNAVAGGTNGAQLSWAHLCDLENAPTTANAQETEYAGFAVNPATRRWLRSTVRATGLPFIWEGGDRPLLQYRSPITGHLPSNLVKGGSGAVCSAVIYSADWSSLVVGIYGPGIDLTVDRVTLADQGLLKITAALLAGGAVIRPAAFSKMEDALTA